MLWLVSCQESKVLRKKAKASNLGSTLPQGSTRHFTVSGPEYDPEGDHEIALAQCEARLLVQLLPQLA